MRQCDTGMMTEIMINGIELEYRNKSYINGQMVFAKVLRKFNGGR